MDSYTGNPGSNIFDPTNVYLGSDGVHLKITKVGGVWHCASMVSAENLSNGTYRCVIQGRADLLDPNMVLAMFSYGGVDNVNEIDIELSRWGYPESDSLNYMVYPSVPGQNWSERFPMTQTSNWTTHRFIWGNARVSFVSQQGVRELADLTNQIATAQSSISPNKPMPLGFNFWLNGGKAPTNGKGAEIVITDFSYTPS